MSRWRPPVLLYINSRQTYSKFSDDETKGKDCILRKERKGRQGVIEKIGGVGEAFASLACLACLAR